MPEDVGYETEEARPQGAEAAIRSEIDNLSSRVAEKLAEEKALEDRIREYATREAAVGQDTRGTEEKLADSIINALSTALPVVAAGAIGGPSAGAGAASVVPKILEREREETRQAEEEERARLEMRRKIDEDALKRVSKEKEKVEGRRFTLTKDMYMKQLHRELFPLAGTTQINFGQGVPMTPQQAMLYGEIDPRIAWHIERANQVGMDPAAGIIEHYMKHPLPAQVSMGLGKSKATEMELMALQEEFNTISSEQQDTIFRLIGAKSPRLIAYGKDSKAYQAQLERLALDMAREMNGGRPTDKDSARIEQGFAKAWESKKVGQKKWKILVATYKLHRRAKLAAINAGPKLTAEDYKQLRASYQEVNRDVFNGALEGKYLENGGWHPEDLAAVNTGRGVGATISEPDPVTGKGTTDTLMELTGG